MHVLAACLSGQRQIPSYRSRQGSIAGFLPPAVDIQRSTRPLTSHWANAYLLQRRDFPNSDSQTDLPISRALFPGRPLDLVQACLAATAGCRCVARDQINNPGALGTVAHLASTGWNFLASLPYRWKRRRVSDRQQSIDWTCGISESLRCLCRGPRPGAGWLGIESSELHTGLVGQRVCVEL